MNKTEILVLIIAIVLVVSSISYALINRIRAKKKGVKYSSCGCDCKNCPNGGGCCGHLPKNEDTDELITKVDSSN